MGKTIFLILLVGVMLSSIQFALGSSCTGSKWFQCNNGKCISAKWVCNGIAECTFNNDGDRSDELNCGRLSPKLPSNQQDTCPPSSDGLTRKQRWACANGRKCIKLSYFCDTDLNDCGDESDEPPGCKLLGADYCFGQFKCGSGECLDMKLVCNSAADCLDGSDESNCEVEPEVEVPECPRHEGKFLCKSQDVCINNTQMCDKTPNCPDSSDEFDDCDKTCANKKKCAHECRPDPDVTRPGTCFCHNGYEVSSRNPDNCDDIDECQNFESCSQLCTNLVGSFECSCADGFKLLKDNVSCGLIQDSASLIYATKGAVRVLNLTPGNEHEVSYSIVENIGEPSDVTFDAREGLVYWTDRLDNSQGIWKSGLNGSDREILFSQGLENPSGVALDWITKNIYYVDKHIFVCSRNQTICTVLITKDDNSKTEVIALHPNLGLMFWTSSFGVESKIMRAGMDGSFPHEIVTSEPAPVCGLTVDHAKARLYWTSSSGLVGKIETSKLDGSDLQQVITTSDRKTPLMIDVIGNKLFFTQRSSSNIESCNKLDGSQCLSYASEPANITGLVIVHRALQPISRKNHCENSGCSHICVLTSTNSFVCKCPVEMEQLDSKVCVEKTSWPKVIIGYGNILKAMPLGSIGRNVMDEFTLPNGISNIQAMVYNPMKNSVIISDSANKGILEYNFVMRKLYVLVDNDSETVMALDVDVIGENLYWVDSVKRTIEVMSLQTQSRKILAKEILQPLDIKLIPRLRVMIIAESDIDGGLIVKLSMDGFHRQVLFRGSKAKPISVTYNRYTNLVYWIDSYTNSIQSLNINGSSKAANSRKIMDINIPFAVTSHKMRLYWTDSYDNEIVRIKSVLQSSEDRPLLFRPSFYLNVTSRKEQVSTKLTIANNELELLEDLLLMHPCSQKSGINPCSHMCLLSSEELTPTCVCPEGLHLDKHGHTCIPITGHVLPSIAGNSLRDEKFGITIAQQNKENATFYVTTQSTQTITVSIEMLLLIVGLLLIAFVLIILARNIYKTRSTSRRYMVRPFVSNNSVVDVSLIQGLE